MGARSSSAKNCVWAVTWRKSLNSLNSSTILVQGPTPDAKLLNWLASLLHLCFVEASPTVEKAVSCYAKRTNLYPHCQVSSVLVIACSTQILGCRERTLRTRTERLCANFDAWCRGAQSASEQLQLCEFSVPTFWFTTQKFCMVGGYTENLEKPLKEKAPKNSFKIWFITSVFEKAKVKLH